MLENNSKGFGLSLTSTLKIFSMYEYNFVEIFFFNLAIFLFNKSKSIIQKSHKYKLSENSSNAQSSIVNPRAKLSDLYSS